MFNFSAFQRLWYLADFRRFQAQKYADIIFIVKACGLWQSGKYIYFQNIYTATVTSPG